MNLNVNKNSGIVFDLDDTLYKEVDFVFSAYKFIAKSIFPSSSNTVFSEMCRDFNEGRDTFTLLKQRYEFNQTIADMVEMYRYHSPEIAINDSTRLLLQQIKSLGGRLGVLTDGRSKTQSNKLRALGIDGLLDLTVISEEIGSEKPSEKNFKAFELEFPGAELTYIGDNFKKDFITPNRLGWTTIGLKDNGQNIHSQQGEFPTEFLPKFLINSLEEITLSNSPVA